jgi:hypothetical protein
LVNKHGLEVHDHTNPYLLGWVNNNAKFEVTKQCKIKFDISAIYIDEVEVDVVPLDVCHAVFGSPCMDMRDEIFTKREIKYHLIKDGKPFIINAHKVKSNISLVSANQVKKLINSSRKFVSLFLRENPLGDESIKVKAYMEGCTKEKKHQVEELLLIYREVFQEPKWLPCKREVELNIELFLDSPLQILVFIDSLS